MLFTEFYVNNLLVISIQNLTSNKILLRVVVTRLTYRNFIKYTVKILAIVNF